MPRGMVAGLGGNRDGERGEGCPERFDAPFLKFVLAYRSLHRPRDLGRMAGSAGRTLRFDAPRQTAAVLARLDGAATGAR